MSEWTGLEAFWETDPTGRYVYVRLQNQFHETIFTSALYEDRVVAESDGEVLRVQLSMAVDFACDRSWTKPTEEPHADK